MGDVGDRSGKVTLLLGGGHFFFTKMKGWLNEFFFGDG